MMSSAAMPALKKADLILAALLPDADRLTSPSRPHSSSVTTTVEVRGDKGRSTRIQKPEDATLPYPTSPGIDRNSAKTGG